MFIPIGDDNSMRHRPPVVVTALVAANAIVWFLQLSWGTTFTNGWATVPYEITHGVDLVGLKELVVSGRPFDIPHYGGPQPIYLTLLSSMFMHGSWMHIIGNMAYLWIFGDNIEDLLGHGRFLLGYLLCGLAAGAAQILYSPDSIVPCLGASGAIAGVLGAYLVRFPHNRVRVIMRGGIGWVPAYWVLGLWILIQVVSQAGTPAGRATGVAYMAHIGGFVAGLVLVFILSGSASGRAGGPRHRP